MADPTSTDLPPNPKGGWSEEIRTLQNAVIVPPKISAMIQPSGVLEQDGTYCAHGALWRKHRPITTCPELPTKTPRVRKGRWVWGGILWVHFGHFLVESSSRLWALDQLEEPVDGILFVPKRPKTGTRLFNYQRDFIHLMAPGLDIRVAAQPNQVETLIVPGQGFGIGRITQGTASFRNALKNRFASHVPAEGSEKLYISRSKLNHRQGHLIGEEKLEAYLENEGYEIFHPELHSIAEQIARYKAARFVIGADGSALHLFSMVGTPDQKVAVVSRRYSAAQSYLIENLKHFCAAEPTTITELNREWAAHNPDRNIPSRSTHGELDLSAVGQILEENGFVLSGNDWTNYSESELSALLESKGFTEEKKLHPLPEKNREEYKRVKEMREARRNAEVS